jgi:hypothetical protein
MESVERPALLARIRGVGQILWYGLPASALLAKHAHIPVMNPGGAFAAPAPRPAGGAGRRASRQEAA